MLQLFHIQFFDNLSHLHMNELFCFKVKIAKYFVSAQLLRNGPADFHESFRDDAGDVVVVQHTFHFLIM